MRALRSSLCTLYGLVAVLMGFTSVMMLMRPHVRPYPPETTHTYMSLISSLFLPCCCIIFGTTAWSYLRKSAAARFWGIASGVLNLAIAGGMILLLRHLTHAPWSKLVEEQVLLLALGAATLMAFWSWDAAAEFANSAATAPRVKGDGTHLLVDWLPLVLSFAGYIAGMNWWWQWARSQGLEWTRGGWFWAELFGASLIVTFVHECGHSLTARLFGIQLGGFVAGPLQWRAASGRWRFSLQWSGFISAEGATYINLNDPALVRWHVIAMLAAGPFANLALGLMAVAAALRAPGTAWESAWLLLSFVGTFSLVAFVANLIPARLNQTYTDGAKIYQMVTGRTLAKFSLAGSAGLRKKGLDCLLAGNPLKAEGYFRQALGDGVSGARMDRVRGLVCLADALQDQDRLREAKDYLEMALELGDETGSGQGSMADLLLLEGTDPQRALALAEEAADRNIANARRVGTEMARIRLLVRRAMAMMQMDRRAEAEAAIGDAMRLLDQQLESSEKGEDLRPTEFVFGRAHSNLDGILLAYCCLKVGQALVSLQQESRAVDYLKKAQNLDTKGKLRNEAQRELAKLVQEPRRQGAFDHRPV